MAHRQIQFGSIVHHQNVPHPDGTPAGRHYGVVVSDEGEIRAGAVLQIAVITTSFTKPLPSGWFLLDTMPGRPGGDPISGLTELSVVKCTWLSQLPRSEFDPFEGKHVPPKVARQMIEWFNARDKEAAANEAREANVTGKM